MSDSIQSGFNAAIHFDGFKQKKKMLFSQMKWKRN